MAKILFVDDSVVMRLKTTQILEAGGFEVICAQDGPEGFRKARELPDINLILVDYNMPGMDGISMVERIKSELPNHKETPVGVLTTESSKELKTEGKGIGVQVWFVKPVKETVLVDTLKKVLDIA